MIFGMQILMLIIQILILVIRKLHQKSNIVKVDVEVIDSNWNDIEFESLYNIYFTIISLVQWGFQATGKIFLNIYHKMLYHNML